MRFKWAAPPGNFLYVDALEGDKSILRKGSITRRLISLCKRHFRNLETWQWGTSQILNNQHPNIRFTMDIEKNSKFPFLDVLVAKKTDNTLGHQVYRKPTHTDRYTLTYMPSRTTIHHKNSRQYTHLCIEYLVSLIRNIYKQNSIIWKKSYNMEWIQ